MFDNLWYLVAAFSVVWVGVFGYLVYVFYLARGVGREIETLTEAIASSSPVSAGRPDVYGESEDAAPPFQPGVRTEQPQ